MNRPSVFLALFLAGAALAACSSNGSGLDADGSFGAGGSGANQIAPHDGVATEPLQTDLFLDLPKGDAQLAALCARGSKDRFATAICATPRPTIKSLADVQKLLGLSFANPSERGINGAGGNPAFAILAHSTSLFKRDVSAANPRTVVFTPPSSWRPDTSVALDASTGMTPPAGWNPPVKASQAGWQQPSDWRPPTMDGTLASWPPGSAGAWGSGGGTFGGAGFGSGEGQGSADGSLAVMSYARGEPLVEIGAHEPGGGLHLYLIHFAHDCGAGACAPNDLYGAASESDWKEVSVYEDRDLFDHVLDCSHCHFDGSGKNVLLMQESVMPWTHWMSEWTAGGQALIHDYQSVHGKKESYGGVPGALIEKSEPRTLELLVRDNGYAASAGAFDSSAIEDEVHASMPAQPFDNTNPGSSATWNTLFVNRTASAGASAPFHDVKITDKAKLAGVATAYQDYLTSNNPFVLPSMRDLIRESSFVEMGIRPADDATPRQVLMQTCRPCHNSQTDPKLTRARFNVDALETMPRAELDLAIARMALPDADRRHMPPTQLFDLTQRHRMNVQTQIK